jgi:hypothetical protein
MRRKTEKPEKTQHLVVARDARTVRMLAVKAADSHGSNRRVA